PVARAHVPDLYAAEIVYGSGHRHSSLYQAAWIARQIGASSPQRKDNHTFTFQKGSTPFTIALKEDPDASTALPRMTLWSASKGVFQIETWAQCDHITARAQTGERTREYVLPSLAPAEESLVNEILMRSGSNLLLARLLPQFQELLRLGAT
ncbi:MAG: hypothetical protein AAF191_13410, partial [Verrucomicrobiota bacterium]